MILKQKKKNKDNNKFDFDNEVIIGISSSKDKEIKSKNKKNKKQKNKKVNKSVKTVKKQSSTNKVSKKKTLSKKGKIVLRVACLFILLACGTCFVLFSPMFNLEEIIVENNDIISEDEIISLSKLETSKNIYSMSKKKIRENIESDPYVESVKISRVWPNKIKITIKERTPSLIAEMADGMYAYIDKNGYIIDFSNERLELPVLIGTTTDFESMISDSESKNNRLNNSDLKRMEIVDKVLKTSDEFEIKGLISKIDITNSKDIALIMESEGKKVYIGDGSDLNRRIMFIIEMVAKEKGINGEFFVDMNLNEKSPYFRETI